MPARCESDCVREGVSVLQEMQEVTRDLQGLVFSDANKLQKFMIDMFLAQASKYESIINKVNLENEVREAGTPHPRKKIETYLGIMGYLWALEWRKK